MPWNSPRRAAAGAPSLSPYCRHVDIHPPERCRFSDVEYILDESPVMCFYRKTAPYDPPEEPELSEKRPINPERLSAFHKTLYGKSLYEKDLAIIKSRRQARARGRARPTAKSPDAPPACWLRAERERRQRQAAEQAEQDLIALEKLRLETPMRTQSFEVSVAKNPEAIWDDPEKVKEFADRMQRLEAIRNAPDRPTRASYLKEDRARRIRASEEVEERRQKRTARLQKEREKGQAKRLSSAISKLNPDATLIRQARMRMEQLKGGETQWREWQVVTDQANEARGTMLERFFLQHENMANLQGALTDDAT
jgi:hypothetical protein